MTKATITKAELQQLYIHDHLPMQEIGNKFNVTRQRIWQLLGTYGIDKTTAERFDIPCSFCGKPFSITRKRFKLSQSHYCSTDCYFAHKADAGGAYLPNRQGQRIARAIMTIVIGRPLLPSETVHHEDCNGFHNKPSNLFLFDSHKTHLKYHHQKRINPGNITALPLFCPLPAADSLIIPQLTPSLLRWLGYT